ncbi:hypothetical protein L1987_12105 [Smallanthus sonchifolius]|uniref:Uncharacterized protein n=1 Tax=Smallanthus sonchifolius TaxID=185202 RepID=A0ACB9JDQ8_9ASTR|nr:hypothetical protein L1987_12105 [Smallanthus sonchifolius]
MSFPGRRRGSTMYSIIVLLLIVLSMLQIWVLSGDCCRVRAIRIFSSSSSSTDSDEIKRSELYRKFFNGRFTQKINATTGSKGKGFQENNRKVPSCPDALHN